MVGVLESPLSQALIVQYCQLMLVLLRKIRLSTSFKSMTQINICQKINCPYFSEVNGNWGCQRYAVASGCHLTAIAELQSTDYALYVGSLDSVDISNLTSQNNHFFLEDPKYKNDLELQEGTDDWFTEKSFKLRNIDSNN